MKGKEANERARVRNRIWKFLREAGLLVTAVMLPVFFLLVLGGEKNICYATSQTFS